MNPDALMSRRLQCGLGVVLACLCSADVYDAVEGERSLQSVGTPTGMTLGTWLGTGLGAGATALAPVTSLSTTPFPEPFLTGISSMAPTSMTPWASSSPASAADLTYPTGATTAAAITTAEEEIADADDDVSIFSGNWQPCEVRERDPDEGFRAALADAATLLSEDSLATLLLVLFCICMLLRQTMTEVFTSKFHWKHASRRVQDLQLWLMDAFLLRSLYTAKSSTLCVLLIVVIPSLSVVEAVVSMYVVKKDWVYDNGGWTKEEFEQKVGEEWGLVPLPDFLKPPEDPDEDLRYRWKPCNTYCDFAEELSQVILVFAAQIMLLILIVLYFREREFTIAGCESRAAGLLVCTMLLQALADSQGGGRFIDELPMWQFLDSTVQVAKKAGKRIKAPLYREGDDGFYKKARSINSKPETSKKKTQADNLSEAEILGRFLMSFLVNGVAYDFFIYLMPLLLMSSETTMDFALNAFAVFFVVQMDDNTTSDPVYLDDSVRYKLEIPPWCWPCNESWITENKERSMRHPYTPINQGGDDEEEEEDDTEGATDDDVGSDSEARKLTADV
eukprot:TRINITY_DN7832_c0_g1_i2.p1 TRINITY_DN7832_c0_g1~~TRINITY_DN7832_c0_g1_i2.p1  ORF type:complete len:562 (-),score=90.98 TRINITY_DN7832_c0_g1_i2:202-1887(-)